MEQPCESRAFFGTVETLVALVYMKGCDRGGCLVSQRQPGKFRCATVSLSHDIDAAKAMGYRSGLQAVANRVRRKMRADHFGYRDRRICREQK